MSRRALQAPEGSSPARWRRDGGGGGTRGCALIQKASAGSSKKRGGREILRRAQPFRCFFHKHRSLHQSVPQLTASPSAILRSPPETVGRPLSDPRAGPIPSSVRQRPTSGWSLPCAFYGDTRPRCRTPGSNLVSSSSLLLRSMSLLSLSHSLTLSLTHSLTLTHSLSSLLSLSL
jgi:hypothetical protein